MGARFEPFAIGTVGKSKRTQDYLKCFQSVRVLKNFISKLLCYKITRNQSTTLMSQIYCKNIPIGLI